MRKSLPYCLTEGNFHKFSFCHGNVEDVKAILMNTKYYEENPDRPLSEK